MVIKYISKDLGILKVNNVELCTILTSKGEEQTIIITCNPTVNKEVMEIKVPFTVNKSVTKINTLIEANSYLITLKEFK